MLAFGRFSTKRPHLRGGQHNTGALTKFGGNVLFPWPQIVSVCTNLDSPSQGLLLLSQERVVFQKETEGLKCPEHFLFHWWSLKAGQGQGPWGHLDGFNRRSGEVMVRMPAEHSLLRGAGELLQGKEPLARDPWRRALLGDSSAELGNLCLFCQGSILEAKEESTRLTKKRAYRAAGHCP